MKPYGRNEYVGLHNVDDQHPDAADLNRLGKGRRSKKKIRMLMKKCMRNILKREFSAQVA